MMLVVMNATSRNRRSCDFGFVGGATPARSQSVNPLPLSGTYDIYMPECILLSYARHHSPLHHPFKPARPSSAHHHDLVSRHLTDPPSRRHHGHATRGRRSLCPRYPLPHHDPRLYRRRRACPPFGRPACPSQTRGQLAIAGLAACGRRSAHRRWRQDVWQHVFARYAQQAGRFGLDAFGPVRHGQGLGFGPHVGAKGQVGEVGHVERVDQRMAWAIYLVCIRSDKTNKGQGINTMWKSERNVTKLDCHQKRRQSIKLANLAGPYSPLLGQHLRALPRVLAARVIHCLALGLAQSGIFSKVEIKHVAQQGVEQEMNMDRLSKRGAEHIELAQLCPSVEHDLLLSKLELEMRWGFRLEVGQHVAKRGTL